MPQLSVVIITFNEEKNIGRCLESIKGVADDIVVVDSFSTDNTESICKQHSVSFIQKNWVGYSETKNFANSLARFDWILSLDADEALSEELEKNILKIKSGNDNLTCSFNRLTNYCGHWVKHCGWYPDRKIRLFDREISKWHGILHEELNIPSTTPVIQLKGDCLHYSYYTLEQHYKQADKFTTIAAQDLYSKGKQASFLKMMFSPVVKFIRDYVVNLGFLDGRAGLIICRVSAYATYLKYKKLRELHLQKTLTT